MRDDFYNRDFQLGEEIAGTGLNVWQCCWWRVKVEDQLRSWG